MAARREVEEPWATAMRKAGVGDPRNGHPSWSALARAVDLHTSTVTALVDGKRKRDPKHVAAVAEALKVSVAQVSRWLDLSVEVGGPYEPPPSSMYLTEPEREAISRLIKVMTSDRLEGGGEHGDSAPTSDGPAPVTPMPTRRKLPGAEEVRAARKKRDPK